MKAFAGDIGYHLTVHQAVPNRPWVLFLHGFMGRSDDFDPLLHAISGMCNPVTIDLAGHGKSDAPRDPKRYRIEQQAADLISVVARLQMDPLIMYGYSMGGRIALSAVLERPDLFRGLILESSSAGIADVGDREARRATDRERAGQIRTSFSDFLEAWVDMPLFGNPSLAEREATLQSLGHSNPDAMATIIEAASPGLAPCRLAECASLTCPVLLIAGENDETYTAIHAKLHETIPDSCRIVIPEAAHRVHLERPNALIEPLSSYLSRFDPINPSKP